MYMRWFDTPPKTDPKVAPIPDDPEMVLTATQHLDDLNDAISVAAARLEEAHIQLLYATKETRWAMHSPEYTQLLDHENYLLSRCHHLKNQLNNRIKERSDYLGKVLGIDTLETDVPLTD